jgi:virginiamycin B lyase
MLKEKSLMSASVHSVSSPRHHTIRKYALALLAATLLATLLWGFTQRADAAVYYAAGAKLGRINNDGTGANNSFIVTSPSQVAGVAVTEEFIYWTNNEQAGTVSRAKMDGSGKETLITGATYPQALTVAGEYIYWTNAGTVNTIGRAKLDGSEVNQSLITGAHTPGGIAVHGEYIYWTNSEANTIGRAKLDGSEVNQSFITGLNKPIGVAVDAEHIYWANFGGGIGETIGRANLDGTGKNQNFITGAEAPRSVAVDAEHVYWGNFSFGIGTTYGRAAINGSNPKEEFITVGSGQPFGIAADARRGASATVVCEPGLVGQSGSCTATVTDTESGTPVTPTGTITFSSTDTGGTFEGDGTCALAPGGTAAEATCSLAYTPSEVGSQTITTSFLGNPTLDGVRATTALTVAAPPTTTTVACTPNPVFVESETSCLATVVGPVGATAPTGEVTFSTTGTGTFEGGETCTLAPTQGEEAACSLTYKTTEETGVETITAEYGGDPTSGSSSGETELTVASVPTATATTVACTPKPVILGGEASCLATVTGLPGSAGPPSGEVTFDSTGSGTFGSGGACTLNPGTGAEESSCSVTYKPAQIGTGKETITAEFGGGPGADPSSGTTELSVAASPTKTTLTCSPNPVFPDIEVSCATTVVDISASPTVPTGEVTFITDKSGTLLDGPSCTLAAEGADRAGCLMHYITPNFGQHLITAKYGGSSTQAASTGSVSLEVLQVHKTTSTLTCDTDTPVLATVPVICTVTVFDKGFPPSPPTGVVTFASEGGGAFAPPTCTPAPLGKESSTCTTSFTAAVQGLAGINSTFEGPPGFETTKASTGLKVGAAPVVKSTPTCAPGFTPSGDPPVCKEPPRPVTTQPAAPKPFSRGRATINRKNGTAALPVYLPGPGKVVVSGAGLVKVTKTVTTAGNLKITVKATGGARKTLGRKGHVSLKVKVTYTPSSGGKPSTTMVPVRLVLAAKKKGSH